MVTVMQMIRPLKTETETVCISLYTPAGFRFNAWRNGNMSVNKLTELLEDYQSRGYTVDGIKIYPL